nr:FAD-binding oxidoreductase [Chthoniobacter flavus]
MTTATLKNLETLHQCLSGDVLLPGDLAYDEARAVWNRMVDRRPAAIVRCRTEADVVQAVNYARENRLKVSIRGGGHNIAGFAVCEDGLMIDLSPMKSVRVDAGGRRASVQPGCTLADVDRATQVHGLATPTGINSTTGIAGLALGGGLGWLSRKYGLTSDNLISARIVTADGRTLHAGAGSHSDLFWALRGGGGNFGVVTEFEFALHPVGPEVLAGLIVYSRAEAGAVLRKYREFIATAPEDLSAWVVLRKAPPLPFLPPGGARPRYPGHCPLLPRARGKAAAGSLPRSRISAPFWANTSGMVPFTRVAAGLRSATHCRRTQLLEVAQLHRAEGWLLRPDRRPGGRIALAGMRDLHRPTRWPGRARAGECDRLRKSRRSFHDERARSLDLAQ